MRRLPVLALLAWSLAAHAADTPDVRAPDRMQSARAAVQAQRWDAAIRELQAAVRETPRDADAHNLLAYSYRKQPTPDLPKAFEHYRAALRLEPRHKGAHEYIGEAYLMDRKPAEAEKHLADLEAICGNKTCEEYASLAKAIADFKARN